MPHGQNRRGFCLVCGKPVRIRRNGLAQWHKIDRAKDNERTCLGCYFMARLEKRQMVEV